MSIKGKAVIYGSLSWAPLQAFQSAIWILWFEAGSRLISTKDSPLWMEKDFSCSYKNKTVYPADSPEEFPGFLAASRL